MYTVHYKLLSNTAKYQEFNFLIEAREFGIKVLNDPLLTFIGLINNKGIHLPL